MTDASPLRAPATISPLETLTLTAGEAAGEYDAWQALAAGALEPNPFFGPQFLLPYLRDLAPGRVGVAVVRRRIGGALVGLAPLGRRRLGLVLPVPHVWTNEFAPLGTPLLAPGAAEAAAAGLLRLARRRGGIVALPEQRLDGQVVAALRAAAAACGLAMAEVSPYERPARTNTGTMEQFYATEMSGKRRRRYMQNHRRIAAMGALVTERPTASADIVAGFEEFLALEQAGWKGAGGTALASDPSRARFARGAIAALAEAGLILLEIVRLDGRPIVVLVNLRSGSRAFAWKMAIDETLSRYSPGVYGALEAMAGYLEIDGLEEIDSLSAPGPGLLAGLWSQRIPLATLLIAGDPLARQRLALARIDVAARAKAKSLSLAAKTRLSGLGRGKR